MSIPTPVLVRVRSSAAGGEDAHGNPTAGWGAPRDWWVHAVAPGASEEPRKPNRDLSVVEWTVYAPADGHPGERDQVSLPWEDVASVLVWHDVEGRPDDWTKGPWPADFAGVVVQLRRPEG